jgi:phosphatidylglycerophosphate synthase
MPPPSLKLWLVESISLARLIAALLFASLAFQNVPLIFLAALYAVAMCSDLIDGYLARRLKAETYVGQVTDLVSDKSLTVVSLLYAAARGVDLTPLSLIAVREIIMMGARLIVVNGSQLLPTNRLLGGVLALLLWGNTFFLILSSSGGGKTNRIISTTYWVCALVFTVNLVARVYVSTSRLKASLTEDR